MFWKKKPSAGPSERSVSTSPTMPSEPPKPILRMNTEGQGVSSIRFAGSSRSEQNQGSPSSSSSAIRPPVMPTRAATAPTYTLNDASRSGPMTSDRSRTHPPAPRVIVSSYDSYCSPTIQPHQRMASYDSSPLSTQPRMTSSPRRSSRPTSPSTSSFGARTRARTEPIPTKSDASPSINLSQFSVVTPLDTPPMSSSHVTTPPTAYVSTFQSRAPPPPSPYRPTNERRRSSLTRNLPEQLPMMTDFAPLSSDTEGLLPSDSRSSVHTLPNGPDVPMLNIIPATPQNQSEEFTSMWESHYPSTKSSSAGLEEAVNIQTQPQEMVSIPLQPELELTEAPSIDVQLDFSPFQPLAELPNTDTSLEDLSEFINAEALQRLELDEISYEDEIEQSDDVDEGFDGDDQEVPSDPLPPSPPFMSYPSLPSLSSHDHESIRSSASESSMTSSSSMSSLASFPDVEEALGSMLASLSDSSMSSTVINTPTKNQATDMVYSVNIMPGLGLGLGIDQYSSSSTSSMSSNTAPLSPRRRAPPPPLDLTNTKFDKRHKRGSMIQSAPIINHRIAFYTTAKAHPNSPSSGIFTSSNSLASSSSSSSTISLSQQQITPSEKQNSYRDSISLTSEASDEDLCTASIISLTPIVKGKIGGIKEVKEEIINEIDDEYENENEEVESNMLGLGLGLGLDIGSTGFNKGLTENVVEVGLAL
ncbi:uncharacterized protein I206_105419 [Kwoniella pini CBS 10737]|uniref:Uncharacterized protein n=1 Tax=Kwoniella pini CBS 10737 TaxID=1296096 RepID=A0A1B9I4A2_9TREE|nr:uncharacterized protein I206_03675 [Kwoniella pini CBS 10737]OCF50355.1 hypothetical protein I206_03675 [Kwoniella pini CBS 10737]